MVPHEDRDLLASRRDLSTFLVDLTRASDQLSAKHTRLVDAMHREHVLGEIGTDGHNSDGLPLPDELMRDHTSHRGTELPLAAMR